MAFLKILLIIGLVALNAFFVAAEYALLSVRRTRLEQLAREGDSRARLVLTLLGNVGALFSGIQLGITVASLMMGWIGEAIMAEAISHALEGYLSRFAALAVAHSISVAIAFLLITVLLMVLGELVPKALAYERAETSSLLLARPMKIFLHLSRYPVLALDGMANLVLRALRTAPAGGHGRVHTTEEVKLIVSTIRKHGLLRKDQEEMIHSVFDLAHVLAREIMVPWPRVTCLPFTSSLNQLLDQVVKDQHSRIPIYEGTPDHISGILYTKDLLGLVLARRQQKVPAESPIDLRAILHQPMIVPETMPLSQLLDLARRKHSQMALVVDEFGTFSGLVTIEDVLEEIVGEIQDEYDQEEKPIHKVSDSVLVMDAAVSLRELADDYQLALPRGEGFETLAGFVLARLGVIPKGGETFTFEGRRYTVLEMEGRRITKIKIEKLPAAAPSPGAAAPQTRTPAA